MEAFDHLLGAWATILQVNEEYPQEIIKQSAIQMFNQYLKTHLSPPDGSRPVVSIDLYSTGQNIFISCRHIFFLPVCTFKSNLDFTYKGLCFFC